LKLSQLLTQALLELADKSTSLVNNKEQGQTGFFQNATNKNNLFVATKKFVTNPKNQQHLVTLQNADATPKQKQLAYTALVNQLAVEMQMPITQVKLLLNNGNSGSYSRDTNNIYINDDKQNNTASAIQVLGHEASHAQDHTQDQDANYTNSKNYKDNREEYANKAGKTTTDLLKFQFDNNDIGTLATTNSHTGNYVNTNSNNRVINPIISENNKTFAQENKSRLDKLTKHVRNDYDKFEYNNPEFKKLYESEQKIALDLYNMHSTNEISTALNNTYPPLSIESKQRILNSLIKAKKYDETHTLERSYENLVTDGILADTLKPIDNALIGVQETIQATKDITNGDITNGAIVIAGAISKKIPGGKQLVDKISSIVDKKKKVRTSKVGDKVRVPSPSNIKDFVTLPRNQGYKNKYTGEIWKKSNTNHSGSVGGEWKVGLGKGKIPTKSNKITVSGTGIILKINK
jgi:filamentous hemagglutinin